MIKNLTLNILSFVGEVASFVSRIFPMSHVTFLFFASNNYTNISVCLKLNRISAEYSYWRQFILGEEIEKKEKSNALEIEKKSSSKAESVQTDVCKTPSAPEGVPIPYPNTAMSSDTSSGSKTVKTEGEMPSVKDDFKGSVGDEAGTSDDESGTGILKETVRIKVLGVPLWIWGLTIIAVLVILWILSSNSPRPIEPLE